jgi:alcohol dehydrogenase class IV
MVSPAFQPSAFEFATPRRVVFGAGKTAEAPAALVALGATRVLLVTGRSRARAAALAEALEARGLAVTWACAEGEPTVEVAREVTRACAEGRCDAVVALGGGSALDLGKAVAALATNGGDPLDYLEVIGKGQPLTRPSLPFVAIPTTAGTGSEATKNAVLGSRAHGAKASLRAASMLPALAIVDPDHLAQAPAPVLAASGLDALSQLVEPFLSARAQPFTDALARDGIGRSARSLRGAVLARLAGNEPSPFAREDLALASLFGGLALANAGLGAVHGFAAPLGALFDAPHGAVCAALLAPCLEANQRALTQRSPAHPALARLDELALLLTGESSARAAEGIGWVRALTRDLGVRGLGAYGVTEADVPRLVEKGRAASSMKANPVALTDDELAGVMRAAL